VGGALVSIAYQEFTFMILMLLEVIKRQVILASAVPRATPARAAN